MQEKQNQTSFLDGLKVVIVGSEKAVSHNVERCWIYLYILLFLVWGSILSNNIFLSFLSLLGAIIASLGISHMVYGRMMSPARRAVPSGLIIALGILLMKSGTFPKGFSIYSIITIPTNIYWVAVILGITCYIPKDTRINIIKLKFLRDFVNDWRSLIHAMQLDKATKEAKKGRFSQALIILENLQKKNLSLEIAASSYDIQSMCYDELENNEKATACIQKAIEINPKEGWYYTRLGGLYLTSGDYKNAVSSLIRGEELGCQRAKRGLDQLSRRKIKLIVNSTMKAMADTNNSDDTQIYTNEEIEDLAALEPVSKTISFLVASYLSDRLGRGATIESDSMQSLAMHYAMLNAFTNKITEEFLMPEMNGRHISEYIENFEILIYDALCFQLNGVQNAGSLGETWPAFYNLKLGDVWNKNGKSNGILSAEKPHQ